MSLDYILSHLGNIRATLDTVEKLAVSLIPGAGPAVAIADTVIDAGLDVFQSVTAPSDTEQPVADGRVWAVADLAEPNKPLFSGSREDAEAWADKHMRGGFTVAPIST